MEIHPPIPDRTTEDLLDIVEVPEHWRPDVVDLARLELIKRGVSITRQETRRKIRINFGKRIERIKARATYSTLEKVLIMLFGPILVVILTDPLLFHSGEGFKRKNWEGFLFLVLGFGLWLLVIFVLS